MAPVTSSLGTPPDVPDVSASEFLSTGTRDEEPLPFPEEVELERRQTLLV